MRKLDLGRVGDADHHGLVLALLGLALAVVMAAMTPMQALANNSPRLNLYGTHIESMGFLDCSLRLIGPPSRLYLKTNDMTHEVPISTISKIIENEYAVIRIYARFLGLAATEIFVRHATEDVENNRMEIDCHKDSGICYANVGYSIKINRPEPDTFARLKKLIPIDRIVAGSQDKRGNVRKGAILLMDRKGLASPAMDGLSGGDNGNTIVYYACGTLVNYH